jgi:MFS family permease
LANDRAPRAPTSPVRLVLLMAASVFINYVDRGNLATAGPLIIDEFHLSASQFGALGSAFFLTYVLAMIPAGWLADRYGAKLVLGAGAAIWSTATLLTGFAGGFASLLALRLLLGVGESPAFPATSKLIATGVAREHIGIANGVTGFGYLFGPAIGTFVGAKLTSQLGWRPTFVIFGVLSLLWLIPWRRVVIAEPTITHHAPSVDPPAMAEILRQRGLWGAVIGHFSGNYTFYFILAWLPTYFVKVRGFSLDEMAWVATAAYAINAAAALAAGWGIDRWVKSGRSATVGYKVPMGVSHLISIACMLGMAVLPIQGCIASLFVFELFMGFSSPGYFGIPQIMAGPTAAARWVGVQNSCGNLPGIIAPFITGVLIDATGSYESAFVLAGLINLVGFVGWVFVLPRIEPIRWHGHHAEPALAAPPAGS